MAQRESEMPGAHDQHQIDPELCKVTRWQVSAPMLPLVLGPVAVVRVGYGKFVLIGL